MLPNSVTACAGAVSAKANALSNSVAIVLLQYSVDLHPIDGAELSEN